ncbi:unnamed protein product [Diplocarpon coronariae]
MVLLPFKLLLLLLLQQKRQCNVFMKLGLQGPAGYDNADGYLGTGQILSPDSPDVNSANIGASGGIHNRAGCAYPDISAVGGKIVIFNKGQYTLVGGTSAAAPVFASVLNRINEEKDAAEKSTVGFVSPALAYAHPASERERENAVLTKLQYAHPENFHDIAAATIPFGIRTDSQHQKAGIQSRDWELPITQQYQYCL